MEDKDSPRISVVIPTRNREKDLEMCIKSLLEQTYPSYEIIVIDDCSSDNTSIICKKYGVKYVRNHKRMRQSYGKNVGIKKSIGQLVAFIDDDCVAQQTWLEELSKSLKNDKNNGIVGGRIINTSEGLSNTKKMENNLIGRILIRFFYLRSNKTGRVYINGEEGSNFDTGYEGEVDFVAAGNMLIDKKKVTVLFDKKLKGNCRHEEFDFCYQAKMKNKIKIFFTPRAVVYHKFSKEYRVDSFEDLYFRKRNKIYVTLKNRIVFLGVLHILSFALTQMIDTFAYMMLCIKDKHFFNAILGKRDGLIDYLENKY